MSYTTHYYRDCNLNNRRSFFSFITGCLLTVFTLAAASIELPDIGDSSGATISPEKEHRLGAAFYRSLQGQGAILDDLETQEYLQNIGRKLVLYSDGAGQEFTFFPIAARSINAFAAPGGFIGVNAGLILNTQSESELAGVLAHEVSHITQRHMARSFERAENMSVPMAVAMIGSLLLGVLDKDAGLAALTAVSAGSAQGQINFTRTNEKEADRVGMALLSRAEFDPKGMPDFFLRLQVANRLTDPAFLPEFLRTHPVTTSRISDSTNRLAEYPARAHKNSEAYLLTKARIEVVAAKSERHAEKIFKIAVREDGSNANHYGYALALTGVGKYEKARKELMPLIEKDNNNSSYLLALAEIEVAARSYKESFKVYEGLNSLYPNYKPVVMSYAKALLQVNRTKEAKALLLDYGIKYGTDRNYYELLAEAEGRDGAIVEAHLALSEFHYLSGETERALEQLRIAEKAGHLDYYHRERLEYRREQIEKELEIEKEFRK